MVRHLDRAAKCRGTSITLKIISAAIHGGFVLRKPTFFKSAFSVLRSVSVDSGGPRQQSHYTQLLLPKGHIICM